MSKQNGIKFLRSSFLVFLFATQMRQVLKVSPGQRQRLEECCSTDVLKTMHILFPITSALALYTAYEFVHTYVIVMPHNSKETCFFVTFSLTSYTSTYSTTQRSQSQSVANSHMYRSFVKKLALLDVARLRACAQYVSTQYFQLMTFLQHSLIDLYASKLAVVRRFFELDFNDIIFVCRYYFSSVGVDLFI